MDRSLAVASPKADAVLSLRNDVPWSGSCMASLPVFIYNGRELSYDNWPAQALGPDFFCTFFIGHAVRRVISPDMQER
jgi:hypothetical protein